MTPQITTSGSTTENYIYRQSDSTYRMGEKNVAGRISKIDALKQAIYHILSTERYSNPIYDKDYGVELEQFKGKDFGYISACIENVLKEALMQDDRIKDVRVINISKSTEINDACLVEFIAYSIYGDIKDGINVLQ